MSASVLRRVLPGRHTVVVDGAALAAIALVSAAVYFVSVRPYNDAVEEARAMEAAVADAEAALSKLTDDTDRVRKSLQAAQEQVSRLRVTLDPISKANARLAAVADLAAAQGVALARIQPFEVQSGARFAAMPIKLEGRGQWSGVTGFIAAMHERFPDVAVVGLKLGAQETASGRGAMTSLECDLVWYAGPASAAPVKD